MLIQELRLPAVAAALQQHARATGRSLTAGASPASGCHSPLLYYFQELGGFFVQVLVDLGWGVSLTCSPCC